VNVKLPDHLLYQPQTNPSLLKDCLIESNELTRNILMNLKPGQELVPILEVVNPPHWEFGHLTWFHEFWVHRKGQASNPSLLNHSDLLFNSSDIAHLDRWTIEMPSIERLLQYNLEVFQKTLELLQDALDAETNYFIQLSIFHQDMHNEAFAYMWQTLGYRAPFKAFEGSASKKSLSLKYIEMSQQSFKAGSDDHNGFIFDNEKWAHTVEIDDFAIANRAVTNGEYLEFIESGKNISDTAKIEIPKYWKKEGGHWYQRFFDEWHPLTLDEPVRHISYLDAKRYCDWRHLRLPTEHELSLLMSQADSQWQISNLWEWTADPFMPFPGFSPDPYIDYSKPWFDGSYQVLKGWSLYTPKRLRRNTFRNFYAPHRYDHFCGFRTCLL
jgi:ergothioneine biosynthesis protein EgtB